MPYDLNSPILANGIRNTHYFNGRLLTAQDLRDDQNAQRQQRHQLGRAIGHGIVHGLEVTIGSSGSTPVVHVTPGLALNKKGQALEILKIPDNLTHIEVALLPEAEESTRNAGLFAICSPVQPDSVFNGGVFILALEPASGYQEKAPMNNFDGSGVASNCDSRYAVQGVQFHLINVSLDLIEPTTVASSIDAALSLGTPASLSKGINLLAHELLNTRASFEIGQDLIAYIQDKAPPTSLLKRIAKLTDCAVPLALIFWDSNGIRLLDMWSVRRRITQVNTSLVWPPPVSDRHLAEGEAMFMQFQQQIASLLKSDSGLTEPQLAAAAGKNYFKYLPPAGILPLATASYLRGFNYLQFFDNASFRPPIEIDYAHIEPLLRNSFAYSPIRLNADSEFWLYHVAENQKAADETPGPQEYLVFTSAHLPYLGEIITEDEPLKITKLTPTGTTLDPIITGETLHIDGGNFRYSVGAQRVSLDGNQINSYDHLVSNDFLLVVDVPTFSGLPENGRDMELRVDNGLDSVSQTVRVAPPEQLLQGNVDVLWNDELDVNPDPNPVQVNNEAFFGYFLNSRASDDADFLITPTIKDANWSSQITILDGEQEPLKDNLLTLKQGEKRPFYIHIANIPTEATRQPFRLNVRASAGQVSGSDSQTITVNEPVEPPDNTITIAFNSFNAFAGEGNLDMISNFDETTNTIKLQNKSAGNLGLLVTFEEFAAIYDVTLTRTIGSDGWLIGLEEPPSQESPKTLVYDESKENMPVNENLDVRIEAGDNVSQTGELELRIQRQGEKSYQKRTYLLNIISSP